MTLIFWSLKCPSQIPRSQNELKLFALADLQSKTQITILTFKESSKLTSYKRKEYVAFLLSIAFVRNIPQKLPRNHNSILEL